MKNYLKNKWEILVAVVFTIAISKNKKNNPKWIFLLGFILGVAVYSFIA